MSAVSNAASISPRPDAHRRLFCGKVRYEAEGAPFDRCLCHCETCRRTTGAPAVAWFTVRPGAFRFTSGDPAVFASSETGLRGFCRDCGAQITFQDRRLDEIDVTTASLDDPSAAEPHAQTWISSRLPWMGRLDDLPTYAHESERLMASPPETSARREAAQQC